MNSEVEYNMYLPIFFFFLAAPKTYGISQAKDRTHASAVTRAVAETMLDP